MRSKVANDEAKRRGRQWEQERTKPYKKKERKKEERQWEKARTGAKALAGQRFPISYQFM